MLTVKPIHGEGILHYAARIGIVEAHEMCRVFNEWKRIIKSHQAKDGKKLYADMPLMMDTARILGTFVRETDSESDCAFNMLDIDSMLKS